MKNNRVALISSKEVTPANFELIKANLLGEKQKEFLKVGQVVSQKKLKTIGWLIVFHNEKKAVLDYGGGPIWGDWIKKKLRVKDDDGGFLYWSASDRWHR